MRLQTLLRLLLLLSISGPWTSSLALELEPIAIDPTPVDMQYMKQQRQSLQDIAARHLGRSFSQQRDRDLDILQTLLDRGLVKGSQRKELQAMGVVMGDLLARELDMHWVIYEDKQGRSRALRLGNTDYYFFPMTLISRRREAGNTQAVAEIYEQAREKIAKNKTPLPFQ